MSYVQGCNHGPYGWCVQCGERKAKAVAAGCQAVDPYPDTDRQEAIEQGKYFARMANLNKASSCTHHWHRDHVKAKQYTQPQVYTCCHCGKTDPPPQPLCGPYKP